MATLNAVTFPVPRRRVRRSLCRLEIIVPTEIIIKTMPEYETGTPSCGYMAGHAEPSRESGRPRLIKEAYITARSRCIIPHISFWVYIRIRRRFRCEAAAFLYLICALLSVSLFQAALDVRQVFLAAPGVIGVRVDVYILRFQL